MIFELCVDGLSGVTAAAEARADRVELCAALALGGLTPAAATVAAAVASDAPIMAMIRPQPGGFDYDSATIALMAKDIALMAAAGVAGVVFGATRDGRLDVAALACLIGSARQAAKARGRPLATTLHRAIDLCDDPVAAVDQVCALGFDNILTSGGAASAMEGAATIAAMHRRAGRRCTIIAAAGVTADNVTRLLGATGIAAVHASCSVDAPPEPRALALGFGMPARNTDLGRARALRDALDRIL